MKLKSIAVICSCCAALSVLIALPGGASAARKHSGAQTHSAPWAHASSCGDFDWIAAPYPGDKLWIRTGPGTNYPTAGFYTSGTQFFAGCTGEGWLKLAPGDRLVGDYVNATYARSL